MGIINSSDKRTFRRIPISLPLQFINLNSNRSGVAVTHDVSVKGIGFITEEVLAPYTPLEMWVSLPSSDTPFYTRGEVAWSKITEQNKYRIGVNLEKAHLIPRLLDIT
jgi:hypothetical protein